MTPETCPVCGADVPPGAKACPSCGADERTGWNEDQTRYDGLDLPDEAYEESSPHRSRRPVRAGISVLWWLVGVVTLAALVLLAIGGPW